MRGGRGGAAWVAWRRGHGTSMAVPGGSVTSMAGGCGRVMVTTGQWSTHGGSPGALTAAAPIRRW